MAKASMINRQKKREKMVEKFRKKREELKAIANDGSLSNEERFKARLALAKLPRNSSPTRLHSRCEITGRPKGYYRKLRMSRIALREHALAGLIPGMVKSSW